MTLVNSYRNPVKPDKDDIEDCMEDLQSVLVDLTCVMSTCFEKPCIVLIDEFDAPFLKAYDSTSRMEDAVAAEEVYEQMTDLLMGILTEALKVCFSRC